MSKTTPESVKDIFKALQLLNNFNHIKRTGANLCAGVPHYMTPSLAEHSYRVTYLALIFSKFIKNANTENILKYCLIHDWGESVINDVPTSSKSFKSYFEEDIRIVYKMAELKALGEILTDVNLDMPILTEEEKQLCNFCDTLELVFELIDLKQMGMKHLWLEKMFKVQSHLLSEYDFEFAEDVVKNIEQLYEQGGMVNDYLARSDI